MRSIFKKRHTFVDRVFSLFLSFTFIFSLLVPPSVSRAQGVMASVLSLPPVGTMVTPTSGFTPALMTGITVHPENPLMFDFIIEEGDHDLEGEQLRDQSQKLIKYFLAALTVPEKELWVNLSPYEKERIIPEGFGDTEMGRDLLAQDYLLKQLAASLMYPEDELGKEFWGRVYQKANELYGTTEIPLNTFNKIWIVPEKAVVLEHGNTAFVVESHLKVMLEEDYVALKNNLRNAKFGLNHVEENDASVISGVTSDVVREVLIPAIEEEVNRGETFANLRQVYNSMILATWYKKNLRDSLLGQVYADQNKTRGIDTGDKEINQKIYNQYIEAFQKGVYNYIRKDYDEASNRTIPRKYFSGGFSGGEIVTAIQVKQVSDLPGSSPARVVEALRHWGGAGPAFDKEILSALSRFPVAEQKDILGQIVASPARETNIVNTVLVEDTNSAHLARAVQPRWVSSPVQEGSPQFGIMKQKEKLAKALTSMNLNQDYYDVVYLVVDDVSYAETKELVEKMRGVVIPAGANIDIVRQPEGEIKGNWSAIINILVDDERWDKIQNHLYNNVAVILSAGTGSRNYPLTATGYADKGKQAAPNGRTYLEQQFKQIMQYFESGHEGMIIMSNDGIEALSKGVKPGIEQGIQFLGATLPIRSDELNDLGTAEVAGEATTEGKPLIKFVEKKPLLNRIMTFYRVNTEKEATDILKQIEVGTKEELLIPTNWADYHLTLTALREIRALYGNLHSVSTGQLLYLQYGLDTAGDLFESATLDEDTYVAAKVKSGWSAEDAIRVRNISRKLREDLKFGFISTGTAAIFIDTGNNTSYMEAAQRLLTDKNMRDLLEVGEPVNGSIMGENVVLGKDVVVESGAVILGNVVIKKGIIKKDAVVINSSVSELVAEENTLTYSVDALNESVYVRSGNLVTDIFFKRPINLTATDIIQGGGRVYHITSQRSHDPKKPSRLIGTALISESGEVLDQPPGFRITDMNGNKALVLAKIHINMPLRLTAKDDVQEYNLIHPQLGLVAHVLSIKGVIKEYYPLGSGVENRDLLNNILGASVKKNLTLTSKDDILYTAVSLGEKRTVWDANIWPRSARYYNQYPSLVHENRHYRVSFAEMAYFPDKAATKDFLDHRLPQYVQEAKKQEDKKGKVSSPLTQSAAASVNPGGIDLNPALLDLQIKRDGNGVPLPLPQQPIGQMHIEGFVPVIINIELIPATPLPFLSGAGDPEDGSNDLSLYPLSPINRISRLMLSA